MPTPALRVLSLIPPMTQLNTPYPSTAYITGFLRSRGVDAVQADVALALVLQLFSKEGLQSIHDYCCHQLLARQRFHTRPPHQLAQLLARRPAF
jgi:hypothetical protein